VLRSLIDGHVEWRSFFSFCQLFACLFVFFSFSSLLLSFICHAHTLCGFCLVSCPSRYPDQEFELLYLWTSPALRARPTPRRALFPFFVHFLHRDRSVVSPDMRSFPSTRLLSFVPGRGESYPPLFEEFQSCRHYERISTRRLSFVSPRTLSCIVSLL